MYAVTTQDRCDTPPRSPTILGSAVLTTSWSSIARTIVKIRPGSTIMTCRWVRYPPPSPIPPTDPPSPAAAGAPAPVDSLTFHSSGPNESYFAAQIVPFPILNWYSSMS